METEASCSPGAAAGEGHCRAGGPDVGVVGEAGGGVAQWVGVARVVPAGSGVIAAAVG